MEIKINQLAYVAGGSFMETIKEHSKIVIGAGVGLLIIGGVVLLVALKKKTKIMVHSDSLEDWEFVTHAWRNKDGEIMITI